MKEKIALLKKGIIIQETDSLGKYKTALNAEIKELYPKVYKNYREYILNTPRYERLGNALMLEVADGLHVVTILGHYSYAYTNAEDVHQYDLIMKALQDVSEFAEGYEIPKDEIYYTERLGCELGLYEQFHEVEECATQLGFTKL